MAVLAAAQPLMQQTEQLLRSGAVEQPAIIIKVVLDAVFAAAEPCRPRLSAQATILGIAAGEGELVVSALRLQVRLQGRGLTIHAQ